MGRCWGQVKKVACTRMWCEPGSAGGMRLQADAAGSYMEVKA